MLSSNQKIHRQPNPNNRCTPTITKNDVGWEDVRRLGGFCNPGCAKYTEAQKQL